MEEIDFENIYIQLFAYGDQLLKAFALFQKEKPIFSLKGTEIHQYVIETIEKYLREPKEFKSNADGLVNYLKGYLLHSIYSNYKNSATDQILSDFSRRAEDSSINGVELSLNDLMINSVWTECDPNVDYDAIMLEIVKEIKNDEVMKLIFEEVNVKTKKQRNLIPSSKFAENEYDVAMNGLNVILNKVYKRYLV